MGLKSPEPQLGVVGPNGVAGPDKESGNPTRVAGPDKESLVPTRSQRALTWSHGALTGSHDPTRHREPRRGVVGPDCQLLALMASPEP
mgnify:CR=1 FL=1